MCSEFDWARPLVSVIGEGPSLTRRVSHAVDLLLAPGWRNIISAQRLIVFYHVLTACCALVISHASSLLENGRSRTKWMVTKSQRANGSFFTAGGVSCTKVEIGLPLIHRDWWEEIGARQTLAANPSEMPTEADPCRGWNWTWHVGMSDLIWENHTHIGWNWPFVIRF